MTPMSATVNDIKRRIYMVALSLAIPGLVGLWLYAWRYDPGNVFLLYGQLPMAAFMLWSLRRLWTESRPLERMERRGLASLVVYAVGAMVLGMWWPYEQSSVFSGLQDLLVVVVGLGAFLVLRPREGAMVAGSLYVLSVASTWFTLDRLAVPDETWLLTLVRELATLSVLALAFSLAYVRQWWSLSNARSDRYERLATTDTLTDLPNRRGMYRVVEEAIEGGQGFSVILADIDDFKRINDTFGHAAGDDALRQFALLLRRVVREDDRVGRWGGEEFVVVVPGASVAIAASVAERIRERLNVTQLLPGRPITASFGVAQWRGEHDTFDEVLQRADAALYRAKSEGKNRVLLEPPAVRQTQVPLN